VSKLSERILKARELKVEAGGVTFIVRRPAECDLADFRGSPNPREIVRRYVIGWEGVTEGHIVNGGDPHPLEFDRDACAEWLADRLDIVAEIVSRQVEAFNAYAERVDREKKA
jgi:hypothetical protein